MILDRRQSRWAILAAASSVVLLGVYVAYVLLSANGARGGSVLGLVFASAGTGIVVFECLLGLRKKYPASPLGRVKTWLSAHVWLGLLAFLLILMHSGFRWGHGLSAALMGLFLVVVASGVLGVVLQNFIPRRMTEMAPRETIFEQIPTVIYGLRTEADERVELITADLAMDEDPPEFVRAGGVKQYFDPEQKKSAAGKVRAVVERRKSSPQIVVEETARQALRAHYLQEIRPFLSDRPGPAARRLFDGPERVRAYFGRLRVMMPVAAHDVLRDLEEICDERRQLAVQVRLHGWLHGWLLVHAPLSFALLVLSAVHAVLSLRYLRTISKEDKPPEYQRRIRDTRTVAQRLDLDYLKRPSVLAVLRSRLSWAVAGAAVLVSMPLMLGLGGGRRALENGPVSEAHVLYEARCEACHTRAFGGVPDSACQQCHDGAPHPARGFDTGKVKGSAPRCAQCHVEHRGRGQLAEVSSGNCTLCHGNLARHAMGLKVRALEISAFRPGRHPEFSPASQKDLRPLRLNHAVHMPVEPKTIRGIKLPMQCSDCHVTDRNSPRNDLLPVTFEANCQRCHSRELEFDVYQLFGSKPMPAPHTRDKRTIDEFITAAYRDLPAADPGVAQRPLGADFAPQPNAAAWLARVVRDSEEYLFNRKCVYCHTAEPMSNRVHRVAGRYSAEKPEGVPWLTRGEFSHRAHRAVECTSCHTAARGSTRTEDVLIPVMKDCMPCHGGARAELERCSRCHLYHNRALEEEHRRPVEKLMGS